MQLHASAHGEPLTLSSGGCAIATAAKAAVRSSAQGVRACARGVSEGERGPRLQQRRLGSWWYVVLYSRTWNCGANSILRHNLLAVAQPPFSPCPPQPRRARCLPPWAARAPGAAGSTALSRWGRLGPTVPEEPQKIGRLTANGPSAGPLASAWVAAAPARLPAFLGAASAGHGRLNGTAPQGRRHICPPAGCERGGAVVQRPLRRSERQLQCRRGGAQTELPDLVVDVARPAAYMAVEWHLPPRGAPLGSGARSRISATSSSVRP